MKNKFLDFWNFDEVKNWNVIEMQNYFEEFTNFNLLIFKFNLSVNKSLKDFQNHRKHPQIWVKLMRAHKIKSEFIKKILECFHMPFNQLSFMCA